MYLFYFSLSFVVINTFGYLEHDIARGILKIQCKPWEFRATSCSRHPDVLIVNFHVCVCLGNNPMFVRI